MDVGASSHLVVEVAPRRSSSIIGLRGARPCVTSPLPETDRLEAKQLRMCLLLKRVEVLRQKSKLSGLRGRPGFRGGASQRKLSSAIERNRHLA